MPYLRPGFFIRRIANPLARFFRAATTLAVRRRRIGEWQTIPVNVLDLEGNRYLMAVRGETEWVRNLRAAGGGELRRRRKTEPFRVTEEISEPDLRARIVGAYLDQWGRQVKSQFEKLPERTTPSSGSSRRSGSTSRAIRPHLHPLCDRT